MRDLGALREQIAAGRYLIDAASIASALLAYADADEPAGASPGAGRHGYDHGLRAADRRGSEYRARAADHRDAATRRRMSG